MTVSFDQSWSDRNNGEPLVTMSSNDEMITNDTLKTNLKSVAGAILL
jgi:hypothetical protein